jgi:peroxiredoxin
LRDHEEEFRRRNAKVVVVTFEAGHITRRYVEGTSLTWPLLIDDSRETYGKYGMLSASFWDVWGPKTWWAYLKEIVKGKKLEASEGDIFQRGGDVLIDPGGIVRLHHVGVGPSDRPTVEALLRRIPSASGV